jgi:hypothetical protein
MCSFQFETFITMAAKKTAKKTAEPASEKIPAPAKPAAKKAPKTAETAPAKKAAAKKIAAKKTALKKPEPASKPSLDTVARAAYLNYRRRVENGLPGDSHGDWLDAERRFSAPQ